MQSLGNGYYRSVARDALKRGVRLLRAAAEANEKNGTSPEATWSLFEAVEVGSRRLAHYGDMEIIPLEYLSDKEMALVEAAAAWGADDGPARSEDITAAFEKTRSGANKRGGKEMRELLPMASSTYKPRRAAIKKNDIYQDNQSLFIRQLLNRGQPTASAGILGLFDKLHGAMKKRKKAETKKRRSQREDDGEGDDMEMDLADAEEDTRNTIEVPGSRLVAPNGSDHMLPVRRGIQDSPSLESLSEEEQQLRYRQLRHMTIEQWAKFLQLDREWVKPLTIDDVQSDGTCLEVHLLQLVSKEVIHLKPSVHLSLDGVALDDLDLMQTVARMPNVKVLSLNVPLEERYTHILGFFLNRIKGWSPDLKVLIICGWKFSNDIFEVVATELPSVKLFGYQSVGEGAIYNGGTKWSKVSQNDPVPSARASSDTKRLRHEVMRQAAAEFPPDGDAKVRPYVSIVYGPDLASMGNEHEAHRSIPANCWWQRRKDGGSATNMVAAPQA